MDRTFMMIKPDGVQRGLVGEIIKRVEQKGLKIVAMKLLKISKELAAQHYAEHIYKDFYPDLERFITSGPVLALVLEGTNAIEIVRHLNGATDPREALPGTIRGDLALFKTMNIVHGSDSQKSAEREIKLFFSQSEILEYERSIDKWI